MINSTSSKNYAYALAELAKDNVMSFENIKNDLNTVDEILQSSKELKRVLENITIPTETKNDIIEDVFKNHVNEKTVNFLKVITDKNKFNEFLDIKSEFENKYNEVNNLKNVEITSAIELSEEQKNRVVNKLSDKLNKDIIADWKLDENIIGGLIIKIDDNVINSSLKNKLEKLR